MDELPQNRPIEYERYEERKEELQHSYEEYSLRATRTAGLAVVVFSLVFLMGALLVYGQ